MGPTGAGDLRDRIKIQRRTVVSDDYGNDDGAFADIGVSRAAKITPTRGGEAVQAGRLTGKAGYDVWVRSDSGTRSIQPGDIAIDERNASRVFNIRFVGDMDGKRTWLLLQCELGVAV